MFKLDSSKNLTKRIRLAGFYIVLFYLVIVLVMKILEINNFFEQCPYEKEDLRKIASKDAKERWEEIKDNPNEHHLIRNLPDIFSGQMPLPGLWDIVDPQVHSPAEVKNNRFDRGQDVSINKRNKEEFDQASKDRRQVSLAISKWANMYDKSFHKIEKAYQNLETLDMNLICKQLVQPYQRGVGT